MIENLVNYNWYIMPNSEKSITLNSISETRNNTIPLPSIDNDGGEVFNEYQPSEREIIKCSTFTDIDTETGITNSNLYLTTKETVALADLDFSNPKDVKLNRNYRILQGIFDSEDDKTLPANKRIYIGNEISYYQLPVFEARSAIYTEEDNYIVFDFNTTFPIPIRYTPYKTFLNGELVEGELYNHISATNTKIKIDTNDISLRTAYNYCKIVFNTMTNIDETSVWEIVLNYNSYESPIQQSTIENGNLFQFFLDNNLALELIEQFDLSESKTNNEIGLTFRREELFDEIDNDKTITFEQVINSNAVNLQDYENEKFNIVGWNESTKTMIIFTQCEIINGLSFDYNQDTNSQSISAKYLEDIRIEHNADYSIKKVIR